MTHPAHKNKDCEVIGCAACKEIDRNRNKTKDNNAKLLVDEMVKNIEARGFQKAIELLRSEEAKRFHAQYSPYFPEWDNWLELFNPYKEGK